MVPRTVWSCQPNASAISVTVAPLARSSMAMSWACLVPSRRFATVTLGGAFAFRRLALALGVLARVDLFGAMGASSVLELRRASASEVVRSVIAATATQLVHL